MIAGSRLIEAHLLEPAFLLHVAPHLVSLRLESLYMDIDQQCFSIICSAINLTALELLGRDGLAGKHVCLSESIARVSSLQRLTLDTGCARSGHKSRPSVPSEILQLRSLSSISITGTSECFGTLCMLPALQALTTCAQLVRFPIKAVSVPNLSCLQLERAVFTGQLDLMPQMPALTSFFLLEPEFEDATADPLVLQQAIAGLGSLTCLKIRMPDVAFNERHLHNLTDLTYLCVHASVDSFSCSSSWQSLECLNLSNNRLLTLPSGLTQLTRLTDLHLADQQINDVSWRHMGEPLAVQLIQSCVDVIASMPSLFWLDVRVMKRPYSGIGCKWSSMSVGKLIDADEALQDANAARVKQGWMGVHVMY